MESILEKDYPQSDLLLSKDKEVSSSQSFNSTVLRGMFGTALQKLSAALASIFIPPETQTKSMENNKKSFTVPDISVDININTPIFEAVQGKAKLTIPEDVVDCDEPISLPFEDCIFVPPVDHNPDKSMHCSKRYNTARPGRIHNNVAQDKSFANMDKNNCNLTKKVSNWTPLHLYNKTKACNKNRKVKNRQTLQTNITEDLWQIADDYESGSDCENYSTPSLGCSVSFSSSSVRSSIDLSESSFPSISSSFPMAPIYTDLPRRSSQSCNSEDSFVMVFDMTTPLSRIDICSASAINPPVLANRQRCRQISECSDDGIVFCYEDEENDIVPQTEFDFDDEDDSEEDETDSSCAEDSEGTVSHQPDSGFEEKKVQFNLKPEVHVMRTWDFAYRQARKGEWEIAARDRERFKNRIHETGKVLSTVFDKNLRDKVYKERFSG